MSDAVQLLLPRAVRHGATVAVCAPAGPVINVETLDAGIAWLESNDFNVVRGHCLVERKGYLAGSDDARVADLMAHVSNPDVEAIIVARGGYGVSRILSRLDASAFREARKPIVGYSDLTSLLLYLRECAGLASIHGPMFERDGVPDHARARLMAMLRGEPLALEPLKGTSLAMGSCQGPLVGGSLVLTAASLGTPWEIDTRGAILFLEEVCEEPYAIDRLLVQLREAGKLRELRGVAIGQLVQCESERYPDVSALDVIQEILAPEVGGPIVCDLPFGHVVDHWALGVGVMAELDGNQGTLRHVASVVKEER